MNRFIRDALVEYFGAAASWFAGAKFWIIPPVILLLLWRLGALFQQARSGPSANPQADANAEARRRQIFAVSGLAAAACLVGFAVAVARNHFSPSLMGRVHRSDGGSLGSLHVAVLQGGAEQVGLGLPTDDGGRFQFTHLDQGGPHFVIVTDRADVQTIDVAQYVLNADRGDENSPCEFPAQRCPSPAIPPLRFEHNSWALGPDAHASLDSTASFLETHLEYVVLLEGHGSETGTPKDNRRVGELRAEATRKALLARGVHPARVLTASFGESALMDLTRTRDADIANRRVEFVLLPAGSLLQEFTAHPETKQPGTTPLAMTTTP